MGIPDRHDANKIVGRSERAGFHPDAKRRHSGRLRDALAGSARVMDWCKANGLQMVIKNDGHHWTITGRGVRAEWWPSSAKLVFDGQFDNGIHTHGWDQLIPLVSARLEEESMVCAHEMYFRIPRRMRGGIIRFVHLGVLPGDFLQAVIRNDLTDSVGRADLENMSLLHIYASMLINIFPNASWGSFDRMTKWAEQRRESRLPVASVEWPESWWADVAEVMGAASADSL